MTNLHRHPQTADELLRQAASLAAAVMREFGTPGHTVHTPEVLEQLVQSAHELDQAINEHQNPMDGN